MSTRAGWTLVCPECYFKEGYYYGILKLRSEKALARRCPNCNTRLVDVDRLRARMVTLRDGDVTLQGLLAHR